MELVPKEAPLYVFMDNYEWAYVYYLFISIGVIDTNTHSQHVVFHSNMISQIDIEYLRKHVRLAYLYHIDLSTRSKDSEEWFGANLRDRNKIIAELTTILDQHFT